MYCTVEALPLPDTKEAGFNRVQYTSIERDRVPSTTDLLFHDLLQCVQGERLGFLKRDVLHSIDRTRANLLSFPCLWPSSGQDASHISSLFHFYPPASFAARDAE